MVCCQQTVAVGRDNGFPLLYNGPAVMNVNTRTSMGVIQVQIVPRQLFIALPGQQSRLIIPISGFGVQEQTAFHFLEIGDDATLVVQSL